MIVGFTGTQEGMTRFQMRSAEALLRRLARQNFKVFAHGGCIGADIEAAKLARALGYMTVRHPGDTPAKQDHTFLDDDYRVVLDNLARNRVIVSEATVMIATPRQYEETLRSGTWATVRYARKQGRPLYVLQPDGRLNPLYSLALRAA